MAGALTRSLRSPRVLIALGMVLAIVFCAVFAGWIAPHDPGDQNLLAILDPPAGRRRRSDLSARHRQPRRDVLRG